MMLGIFWPLDVWASHEGGAAPKELITTYTWLGKSLRGVFREPSCGEPIGTIRVTQKTAQLARKVRKVEDSHSAPRGEAAVRDVYDALQRRAAVTPEVKENGGVNFKAGGKKRPAEDEDELDALWTNPFATSSGAAGGAAPRKAGPQMQMMFKKQCSAATTSNLMLQWEVAKQVLLRCKQLKDALNNPDTVMDVHPNRIKSTMEAISSRTQDKHMEIYAADYDSEAAAPGQGVDGMDILKQMREYQNLFERWGDVVSGLRADGEAGQAKKLIVAVTALKKTIIAVPEPIYAAVWHLGLKEAEEEKNWTTWAAKLVFKEGWPFGEEGPAREQRIETALMTTMINIFRVTGQDDEMRDLLKALKPFDGDLMSESLQKDVASLRRVAFVAEEPNEDLDEIVSVCDGLVDTKAPNPSRWSKA